MKTQNLLSVIMVNFNGGGVVLEAVHSVLAADYPLELIVVDNASSDGSDLALEMQCASYSNFSLLRNVSNLGFSVACNQAVEQAGGDYFLFLNPDCFLEKNTLTRLFKATQAYGKSGLFGCLMRNPDGSEQAGCRRNTPTPWLSLVKVLHLSKLFNVSQVNKTEEVLPEHPIEVDAISGAFMLTSRQDYEAVGRLDEGYFLHCEDLDLCMRYRKAGKSVVFVPTVEVMHVKGSSSNDRKIRVEYHKHKGMLRYYDKFFQKRYPFFIRWAVFSAVWGRFVLLSVYLFIKARYAAVMH